jgi:hypothetical protein
VAVAGDEGGGADFAAFVVGLRLAFVVPAVCYV